MNIHKYSDFFHDGRLINIEQVNDKIEISMQTSQLWPEWNPDNIALTNDERIKGKLHLKEIKSIIINDHPIDILKMLYDTGEILDFDLFGDNKVKLGITWSNYPPKKRINVFEIIEIEAEKIYWENIPDLYDPYE